MNSVERIPKPTGITISAGPGKTIIAIPSKSTVNPITAIIILLACAILLRKSAVIRDQFFSADRNTHVGEFLHL